MSLGRVHLCLLTSTVGAMSQVAGGSSPQRLRELVPRHPSPLLGHQIGEQKPALPSRKTPLVGQHSSVSAATRPARKTFS